MAQDVRFICPNRPGAAAVCFGALADAGINVMGACGDLRPGETWGYMHVVVESGADAQQALESVGIEVTGILDVDLHQIEDSPGALLELYRRYADSDDNVEVLYMAGDSRWVIGTETMRLDMPGRRVGDS